MDENELNYNLSKIEKALDKIDNNECDDIVIKIEGNPIELLKMIGSPQKVIKKFKSNQIYGTTSLIITNNNIAVEIRTMNSIDGGKLKLWKKR